MPGEVPDDGNAVTIAVKVTEISNVKCITRLPKETKRQAVAIIFMDDSAQTFTCDSEPEAKRFYEAQPKALDWGDGVRAHREGSECRLWHPCHRKHTPLAKQESDMTYADIRFHKREIQPDAEVVYAEVRLGAQRPENRGRGTQPASLY